MHYVYIIESLKTGKYYIGTTADIERRLREHNSNKTRSTKNRGPWKMVYKELFKTKTEALCREKRIKALKSGNGFKKLLISASPSSSLA